jgi:hypothetical protein
MWQAFAGCIGVFGDLMNLKIKLQQWKPKL